MGMGADGTGRGLFAAWRYGESHTQDTAMHREVTIELQ